MVVVPVTHRFAAVIALRVQAAQPMISQILLVVQRKEKTRKERKRRKEEKVRKERAMMTWWDKQ